MVLFLIDEFFQQNRERPFGTSRKYKKRREPRIGRRFLCILFFLKKVEINDDVILLIFSIPSLITLVYLNSSFCH